MWATIRPVLLSVGRALWQGILYVLRLVWEGIEGALRAGGNGVADLIRRTAPWLVGAVMFILLAQLALPALLNQLLVLAVMLFGLKIMIKGMLPAKKARKKK